MLNIDDKPRRYNGEVGTSLDWERVPRQLRLRNWRPGDRYRPSGMRVSRKIKDLFQRERVCVWERAAWPVIAATGSAGGSGRIVWARKFGPAHEFATRPESRRALIIDEVRVPS